MATPIPSEKREILACAADGVRARRQADVDDLARLLAWADGHSGDPQAEPGAVPVRYGGPKLIAIGGEGTPGVNDLCFAEIAIAREAGERATQNATADVLDLRHRLPRFWGCVQELACEPWVARKVASLSRRLSREAVRQVDAAVVAVVEASPYRILAVAEAAIIAADPEAHRARIAENERRRGVWLSEPRVGESVDDLDPTAGIRTITGRLAEADAVEFHHAVDDLADALAAHGGHDPADPPTRDQLRADAMALLGRPEDALTLLHGSGKAVANNGEEATDETAADAADDKHDGEATRPADHAEPPRRNATIFAHLSLTDLLALRRSGLANVEALGPMLLDQLAKLLAHRHVELAPVIDLHTTRAVNGYTHPDDVKLRTLLRTSGDVFPHTTVSTGSTNGQNRLDHDHPKPYDRDGPPGQTGDHNDAPLTRRHHRAKTHAGHRIDQIALGVYRWTTPHGLARIVTPTGTKKVDLITNNTGDITGEIYNPPPGMRIELDWTE